MNPILTDENLKIFIQGLDISKEQESFLLDELPKMDEQERMGLLDMLKNVYQLNEEQAQSVKKAKAGWQDIKDEKQPG